MLRNFLDWLGQVSRNNKYTHQAGDDFATKRTLEDSFR